MILISFWRQDSVRCSQISVILNMMVMTVADMCGRTALAGSTAVERRCMTCKCFISLNN